MLCSSALPSDSFGCRTRLVASTAYIVAAAAGDDDVAAQVLEVEGAVPAETKRLRDLLRVFGTASRLLAPAALGLACRLRGPPCRLSGLAPGLREHDVKLLLDFVLDLVLDLVCVLVDRALDVSRDGLDLPLDRVREIVGPVLRRGGSRREHRHRNGAAHLSVDTSH